MNTEPSLTVSMTEACAMLGVSRNTVRKLIREGDLPAAKVTSVWRFRRADVEALLPPAAGEQA